MLLTEIIVPFLFLIYFIGAKPAKPMLKGFHEQPLAPDTCRALKGVFAVVVILHHISQRVVRGEIFEQFIYLGALAVSVFFFVSGYGLQKSCIDKPDYYKTFIQKRLPTILFPYALVNLLYWLLYYHTGTVYTFGDIMHDMFLGSPTVMFSWYVVCIFAFYVWFWLLMLLFRKHPWLMVIGAVVFCIGYTIACKRLDFGNWRYNTVHLLPIGMAWAVWEKQITAFIRKYYYYVFASLLLSFGLLILANLLLLKVKITVLPLAMVIYAIFLLLTVTALMKLKIGNKILFFLGGISFELYLCHGIFLFLFRSDIVYLKSDALYAYLVLLCSIAFATVMNIFDRLVLSGYNKLFFSRQKKKKS